MSEWRPVKGFEGLYEVSSEGLVRSLDRLDNLGRRTTGMVLKQLLKYMNTQSDHDPSLRVALFRDGKRHDLEVDRLVAEAFIEQPEGCPYVKHRGDSLDNRVENLYWSRLTGGDLKRERLPTGERESGAGAGRRYGEKVDVEHRKLEKRRTA